MMKMKAELYLALGVDLPLALLETNTFINLSPTQSLLKFLYPWFIDHIYHTFMASYQYEDGS